MNTAYDHDKERERIALPGPGIGRAPRIAEATDKELRDCLEKDLAALASIADREASIGNDMHNASLTREGLLSPEWHEQARRSRSSHANLAVAERVERRIRAIRAELPRREALRKLEAKTKAEETRRRLEGIVEHAPVHARNLQLKASEVAAAWQRVRQFIADVELLGGGVPYVENQYFALCSGAQQAAEGLGVPVPEFDPLPALPSQTDVRKLLAILSGGGRDGFDRIAPNIGDAADARELVRELNKR